MASEGSMDAAWHKIDWHTDCLFSKMPKTYQNDYTICTELCTVSDVKMYPAGTIEFFQNKNLFNNRYPIFNIIFLNYRSKYKFFHYIHNCT